MNNQTNQEQKKNKAAATGNNPEVIKLDFNQFKEGLSGFVRGTVEEALNGLLQAEAEDLCSAKRHERNEGREAYRSETFETLSILRSKTRNLTLLKSTITKQNITLR